LPRGGDFRNPKLIAGVRHQGIFCHQLLDDLPRKRLIDTALDVNVLHLIDFKFWTILQFLAFARAALVQAYGPVCIERFKDQPNVEAKWVELTKVDSWRRDAYIKESGFATPPGSTSPNPAVADACADALSKIIAMQLPVAK
jgi:hypothetical protein